MTKKRILVQSTVLFSLLTSLTASGYGFYQLAGGAPRVFYANALDESNYLQYWFSELNLSVAWRPAQAAVSLLHRLGVSGAEVNLIFDALLPPLFFVLLLLTFLKIDRTKQQAFFTAGIFFLSPQIFSPMNPILQWGVELWYKTESYRWLTMPESSQVPFWRTPEPQLSYIFLTLGVLSSLLIQSVLPLLCVIPLLYSFVALPVTFCAVSLLLKRYFGYWSIAFGYVSIGILTLGIKTWGMSSEVANLGVETHAPLITLSGLMALALLPVALKGATCTEKIILCIIAAAPWASSNQQIISGIALVPSNSEQYFNLFCPGYLLTVSVARFPSSVRTTFYALTAAFLLSSISANRSVNALATSITITPALLESIQTEPERVAVNDVTASTTLGLLYPQQPPLLFSFNKVYLGYAPRTLQEYRCAKGLLMSHSNMTDAFAPLFRHLDGAYRHETEDNPLNHLGRRAKERVVHDTSAIQTPCEQSLLKVFLIPDATTKPTIVQYQRGLQDIN